MSWGMAAAIAAPIVGSLIGAEMAKKDARSQKDQMKKAMRALKDVGLPPDLAKELIVEELQRQGIYSPQMQEQIDVADSEFQNILIDPTSREAQLKALGISQNLAQVGLGAEDKAALNEINRRIQRDQEAKRQQILQQMQAQGMGGSGASLIAQLGGAQDAAELASQQSDQVMAQASSARRNALEMMSRQAGELRQSDYNQASDRARALDERNRFVAQNAMAREAANVGAANEAQRYNLGESQRLHEQNIANRRAEELRQRQESGAQWDRKLSQAGGQSNAAQNMANFYGQQANQTAQQWQNIGQGVATGAGAYGQYSNQQNMQDMYAADKGLVQVDGQWTKKKV